MFPDLAVWVVSLLLTVLVGIVSFAAIRRAWLWDRPRAAGVPPKPSYSDFMEELTSRLSRATGEIDDTVRQIQQLAEEQQSTLADLDFVVFDLESKEQEMRERIAALEDVSLPAVEHLTKLMEPGERRARNRDWIIFILGLVAGLIIQIASMFFLSAK